MIKLNDDKIAPYLTPYKYPRPVLTGSGIPGAFDEMSVDIPFVFYHNNQFYMLYTGYDGVGYQSALAVSDDLLNWRFKAVILGRDDDSNRWDRVGAAATWMIKESDDIYEPPRLRKVDGKYWLVYHSYPMEGYEAGPAEISLAWTTDEELLTWHRLEDPIFSWQDGRDWEKGGLYKACIVFQEDYWYLFYNAKDTEKRWNEQTGMAKSKDLIYWERCDNNPILRVTPGAWDGRFVSDPYIVRDKELWLNFYFGYDYGHAQEGLAISRNLVDWEKLDEPIISHGLHGELDENHAHKASIFYNKGILYHFYCATRPYREGDPTKVHNEFRTIVVATSKPIVEVSRKDTY